MRSRGLVIVVTCVAVFAVLIGATACGSSTSVSSTTMVPSSTTAAMATTSTVASATTSDTAASTDSTAASSAGSSTTLAPELQQYLDAMNTFGDAFSNAPDSSFLKITDPTTATAADVKQADDASAFSHKAQDQLLAIEPPALVAALHSKVVSAFQTEVKTMDEFIGALKSKDGAKMKSAHDALVQQADELTTLVNQVMAAAGGQ